MASGNPQVRVGIAGKTIAAVTDSFTPDSLMVNGQAAAAELESAAVAGGPAELPMPEDPTVQPTAAVLQYYRSDRSVLAEQIKSVIGIQPGSAAHKPVAGAG